jgi:hypothetical protein
MARLGLAVRLLPGSGRIGTTRDGQAIHVAAPLGLWHDREFTPAKIYPGRVPEAETVPGRPTGI